MKRQSSRAFTLLEMMVVVIIIGIMAQLAISQYGSYKEKAADSEAKENLKLIRAAERIYAMEAGGAYYPGGAVVVADIPTINSNLKLDLSNSANHLWDYSVSTPVANNFCVVATRNGGDARQWSYTVTDPDDPDPDGNCNP